MRAFLRAKRGSTSVMLLLLMVVLIMFGVLAFLSAYGNYRLGQSGQQWMVETYALDSRAEELLAQVDGVLYDAEIRARAQLCDPAAAPDPALAPLLEACDITDREARALALFPRIYLYYAAQGLSGLGMDATTATPDFSLVYAQGDGSPEAFLNISLPLEDEPLALSGTLTSLNGRHILAIDCRVRMPEYSFIAATDGLVGTRAAGSRYRIARWQQVQPPLEPQDDGFDGTVTES